MSFAIVEAVGSSIKRSLNAIRGRIEAAAVRAGRFPDDVKLVAVSKTHPPEDLVKALKSGVAALGENKVQEAEEKIQIVGREAAEWHLIGNLQKNKVRKAVQLFDVIQTVDSPELVHRLERICEEEKRARLDVLVQVDLAGEKTKSGVPVTQLQMVVESLKRCERLRFNGLMVLPPYFEDPELTRPYFQRLRDIRDRLEFENVFANGAGDLSMGMSHDFEVAIEEGATIIRVGTAIFGQREKA